jgi:hypothetical protein
MPQVPLAEYNNMVETFPADGADQALRIACPYRKPKTADGRLRIGR